MNTALVVVFEFLNHFTCTYPTLRHKVWYVQLKWYTGTVYPPLVITLQLHITETKEAIKMISADDYNQKVEW